ncbi:nitronate monooxygenase [Limosilactobacillus fermentum]|uniref:nitronate monooxygenase n=1 Tax=Limosilactobacillus fermentum TaxID=1613 RepID=UPI0021F0D42F|nr:nitronate monooxygenase [Limosilactobacillus fermentum]
MPQHFQGTFTVVPTMADAVSIPVLAAGGSTTPVGLGRPWSSAPKGFTWGPAS